MKRNWVCLLGISLSLFVCSCRGPSDRIICIIDEWNERKIIYPTQMYFTIYGQDTVSAYPVLDNKYSIITYVDSVGCMNCKLKLREWLDFIVGLDSLADSSIPVHFFLHPKNRNEIISILRRSNFNYPVCIDEHDSLNILNNFPQDMAFQTFLLDRSNKVIAVGNPVHNPKIKELYLKIITGESIMTQGNKILTQIKSNNKYIDFGNFDWEQEQTADWVLTNIGKALFVVEEITTSCGCTIVDYSKEPIRPGQDLRLKVKYRAEYPEHFDKTITVYCNVEGSPLSVRVVGNAK